MMGSSKPPSKEVVGFDFQEIPLDEAVNAVIAGDGVYAEVKAKLLEALPKLEAGRAFAFGLGDGKEVPEDQRRGICMAVNGTLKKAKLPWRVTYSGTKKLFVCVPRSVPRTYEKANRTGDYVPRSKYNALDNTEIVDLWKQGLSVTKIIAQTGADPERVKYVCYQKNPRKVAVTHPGNGKLDDDTARKHMETMMVEASRLFKITPEHIAKGLGHAKAVRKAICVVAVAKNIAPRIVAEYVGISKGGVKFNAHQQTAFGKKEIAALQAVYRG